MEGVWYEGIYMPGIIFSYITFGKILVSRDKNLGGSKKIGSPWLRDLEWMKGYIYLEARGFSGFSEDSTFTCYRPAGEYWKIDNELDRLAYLKEVPFPKETMNGKVPKKFKPARTYLWEEHTTNLGKPLMQNSAKNVIDIECFHPNTEVLMSDYSKKRIKDISVGDYVMGKNTPTKVVDVHRGRNTMYKLTYRGGNHIVSKGHLVYVRKKIYINNTKTYKYEYLSIPVEKLYEERHKQNKYYLCRNEAIEFEHKDLPNPYLLGLWLADGRTKEASICMTDLEPLEYVSDVTGKDIKVDKCKTSKQSYTIYFGSDNLLNGVGNKRIPLDYLQSSKEQRLQLLAGIIDGDGWLNVGKSTQYIIGEPKLELAEQYHNLIKSLGFSSSIKHKQCNSKDFYYISVGGDIHEIPVKIERKKVEARCRVRSYDYLSFNIERLEEGDFVGIEVDVEDSLFRLADWVITHNCRGSGKSYFAAWMVEYNFITDGCFDYDEYLLNKQQGTPASSNTLVCAIDTKYTMPLLDKVLLHHSEMSGGYEFQGVSYPPPIRKKMEGTWLSGKQTVSNRYRVKRGGSWHWKGTGSSIYHRTVKDNPSAVNGLRVDLAVCEEIGFMENAIEVFGFLKDVTYDGAFKYGTIWGFGTGGEMSTGATEAAMELAYNPDAYDCLVFDDEYEPENTKGVGLFVPYHLGLNQFKNDAGFTNKPAAKKWIEGVRDKLRKLTNKTKWFQELQNNPEKLSEAFLISNQNLFPVADLKEQLNYVRSKAKTDVTIRGYLGELVWANDTDYLVKWVPDLDKKLQACKYRHKRSDDTTGAVQVWEHPVTLNGEVPNGLYIAGLDPYAQDTSTGASLGSVFIYKLFSTHDGVHELPVAEYTARPNKMKDFNENVLKLLTYYNARCLYENNINNFKEFCDRKKRLSMLAKTPTVLKATNNSTVSRQYGIHMTKSIKEELETYFRDWLIEEDQDGKLNLHKLYSQPLLEELISYNPDGNFDRVIAMMLVILYKTQRRSDIVTIVKEEPKVNNFFKRAREGKFFV